MNINDMDAEECYCSSIQSLCEYICQLEHDPYYIDHDEIANAKLELKMIKKELADYLSQQEKIGK